METIDWILRITGLISIILVVLSAILSRNEHISNFKIKFLGNSDKNYENEISKDVKYYDEYIDEEVKGELTLFTPNGCDIKYLKIYSLEWINKKNKLKIKECLKTYRNIKYDKGILLDIYFPEGIPNRKIEWKADYGVKGEHIFGYNGFNGNVDIVIYNYKFGLLNKLRKAIGFK